MKFKSNLAYQGQNFKQQRQNRIFKKNHVGRVQSNTLAFRFKFYIFSIIASALFFSTLIFSLMKSNEITSKLNRLKTQMKIQTSENIRLKTQLEQQINLHTIETYAKDTLGMKKLDNKQINYIYFPQNKSIELTKKEPATLNFKNMCADISGLWNKIKNWFS